MTIFRVPPTAYCLLATACCLLPAFGGCSRAFYRRQADAEAYALMDRANHETDGSSTSYAIQPDPESRMFDPNCPDRPPMPPDDPTSHRLMHEVDCKRGSSRWDCYGTTPYVENPDWKSYLSYNEQGQVPLDREEAVRLALVHSREYQQALEDLYLSALDVAFEQFRFDAQFFGGNSTFFTADGPARAGGSQSLLETDTKGGMNKLFAGGGQLVVEMANSLVWQFAGPDSYGANTLLDFSLVQPLLRAAGRAVVLEQLTDTERALLANIRQMERFRRGFYARVVIGRGALTGPARGGVGFGAVSTDSIRSAAGFFGLLRQRVEIRNQLTNIAGLRTSFDMMQANYDVGLATSQQVNTTFQGLLRAQSDLLGINAGFERTLDAYKIQLGLPPDIELKLDDPFLARFDLIDPALTATRETVADVLDRLREAREHLRAAALAEGADPPEDRFVDWALVAQAAAALRQDALQHLDLVDGDLQRLEETLPARRKSLQELSHREEVRRGEIEARICSVDALDRRVVKLQEDLASVPEDRPDELSLADQIKATAAELEQFEQQASEAEEDSAETTVKLNAWIKLMTRFSDELLTLSLIQARARLHTITLTPIGMEPENAIEIARTHRRDWRNARAALVDTWRQIEVTANNLESDLDLTFSGDINTSDNHPLRFRGTTGRLRVGLEFDAPLTRLAERNAYRETLIDYQRARRQYYTIEDGITASLRDTIRTIRVNQLDFEVQRTSVFVAIARVDEAQLRLKEPGRGGAQLGGSAARDLVEALTALLDAQNAILRLWVNQEALRMDLDLNLGTMRLDHRGRWIDPGEIGPDYAQPVGQTDAVTDPRPEIEILPTPAAEGPPDSAAI